MQQMTNDRGRELLVGLACSAFFGMLVMLVSKELVADIAIQVQSKMVFFMDGWMACLGKGGVGKARMGCVCRRS